MLYFPKISQIYFCDPCFYATVGKFRLLGDVILLHATVLGMTVKGLVSICFQKSSFHHWALIPVIILMIGDVLI